MKLRTGSARTLTPSPSLAVLESIARELVSGERTNAVLMAAAPRSVDVAGESLYKEWIPCLSANTEGASEAMLPFEFTIDGPPISAQSQNARRLAEWKARVRAVATRHWPEAPFPRNVRVVVTYYHAHRFARLDTDNMVKPILDALIGLVYFDDRQATHIQVRSINMEAGLQGLAVDRDLLKRLEQGSEFLHIRVDEER